MRRATIGGQSGDDADAVAAAAAVAIGTAATSPAARSMLVVGALLWVVVRRRPAVTSALVATVLIGLTCVAMVRGTQAWADVSSARLGPFDGMATVVADPQPYPRSTRVIVEVEGERFETWAFGRGPQARLHEWRAGDRIVVSGARRQLTDDRARRVAWQHVVGRFDLEWTADGDSGTGLARMSNRVRGQIERAARHLRADDGALYRGLVIGDDRDQPPEMIDRFRRSGLSHLTAVSGQNVALVLAAAGPLLRTLAAGWRWLVTCALVGWFVVLTRFEPSILRAGVMAILTATTFATGRPQRSLRTLAVAVLVLVLVDPLLVWSVGFWLSVGATAGVVVVGPWIAARIAGAGPLAMPVAITLGAQAGVAVPSLLVFGRLPLVSLPANVLAVPVAGFVMLYGLPAGLAAAALPPLAGVLMAPVGIAVRWVDTVALVASRAEPAPPIAIAGWLVVLAGMVALAVRRRRAPVDRHRSQ